jgi:putative acetyltransferase
MEERIMIRKATPEDCDAIADVHRRSIREGNRALYTPEQITAWSSITAEGHRDRLSRHTNYVAVDNSRVVGFGIIKDDEIKAVYVDPNEFKKGIGRLLMTELERDARGRAVEKLHLHASRFARPFYERMGYVVLREEAHVVNGVNIDGFLMEKKLTR